ncbi:hypothetical protein RHMOL_Rhmol01G0280800 [Rhododendron molle]|uniref:Uncharacterized protein n=1 Tax=Rhododendron molle TaxID=49168 RepID=A0ACC0Q916_RHOML|nr:hypothetical protein RHMOL_Rhmol01G0280800 [Rhododendron molle]
MNINAAKGSQDVLKTNLGPKGTIKIWFATFCLMILLFYATEQIQNPTAIMIARTAVAQDDISGDGTTSTVLFIGELMKQSERYIDEGMHPRVLVDGFEIVKRATLQSLKKFETPVVMGDEPDKEILKMVARTTLRTKVLCIWNPEEAIDLFMVEIMYMRHKFDVDTRLVGLNFLVVQLHLEVNAGFFYSSAEQREAMIAAERHSVDERVKKIIELKNKFLEGQRGEIWSVLACGGEAVNSVDDLTLDCLGWAGLVYGHVIGEDKYTFVENVKNPHSCTILIKGPNDHTIAHIKGAVRDGLRAVKNTIEDESVVLGAGAFEVAARQYLVNEVKKTVQGIVTMARFTNLEQRAQLGVEAFADALLVVPKTLAENSGLDTQTP